MCIEALRGRYRLIPSDIGEDALMKAKGMTFTTGSYEVEGLGHLCVLRMKAFAMKGGKVPVVKTGDSWKTHLYELLTPMTAIRDRDSDLKDYCPGDHWYDDIKYPCSYSKKDRNAAGRFNAAARSYLRTYLKQAESAKPCGESEKTVLIRNYAEQLISKGGPAVDQVTRLFGDDFARRLILRHMYGADEQ